MGPTSPYISHSELRLKGGGVGPSAGVDAGVGVQVDVRVQLVCVSEDCQLVDHALPAQLTRLEAALQRLLAGTPQTQRLVTLAQKRKIRLSFAVIAEEAEHSRTLTGFDGCQYQKFREKVKAILEKGPRATDLALALETANERIRALEAQLCMKDSIQASLLLELASQDRAPMRTIGKVTHISRQ